MAQSMLLVAIFVSQPAPVPAIVARAEKTELRRSDGSVVRRVERDATGQVTELILSEMQLTREEVEELGMLPELRRVVLYRTNFGDDGLKHLIKCTRIESLNLTGTDVSDDCTRDILEFKHLKYLCLGDVRVSPDAVRALKEQFRSRGQDVRLGYSQRKQ